MQGLDEDDDNAYANNNEDEEAELEARDNQDGQHRIIHDRANNLLSRQASQAQVRDVVGPNAGALIGEAREVQHSEINLNLIE